MVKKDYLNLNFGDDDLKDALTSGNGDQDGIKVNEHYNNVSIKLWSMFFVFVESSHQEKSLNIHTLYNHGF